MLLLVVALLALATAALAGRETGPLAGTSPGLSEGFLALRPVLARAPLQQVTPSRRRIQERQEQLRRQMLESRRRRAPVRRHAFDMPLLEDPRDPAGPCVAERWSDQPHEFYFTRAAYSGYGLQGGFASWSVDYPKADRQFMVGVQRLINHLDLSGCENPILLDDPELSRFPFLYAVEVGYMSLTDAEVQGLRRYLLAGGFLVIDDFWGTLEWSNAEAELARVLPEYRITDLPLDHALFHCFYDVREIVQVPNLAVGRENARSGYPTHEKDGFVPRVRGISDENGRLLVVLNWNSDLGDAWEWAEDPYYPLRFSTYAYQVGINFIVYAMSH